MLLLLLFILPLIISIILHVKTDDEYDLAIITWSLIFLVSCCVFFTGILRTRSDIREFEAFRSTIKEQRLDTISPIERLEITKDIIEQNQWLAKEQYWAESPWIGYSYDKAILDIKPIK